MLFVMLFEAPNQPFALLALKIEIIHKNFNNFRIMTLTLRKKPGVKAFSEKKNPRNREFFFSHNAETERNEHFKHIPSF